MSNDIEFYSKKIRETLNKLIDIQKKEDETRNLYFHYMNKRNELDDNWVKIVCPNCKGTGTIKQDTKRIVCNVCAPNKGFIWARRYKDRDAESS